MKIRHDDIIIDEKEPFKNCKLGRKQYATVLTGIVNTYKDGFVMGSTTNGEEAKPHL